MAEERMNLTSLQGIDPYIVKILVSATQVALYEFKDSEWVKTQTEGALFVHERSADPQFGFVILNRLSTKNLIEPVTKELDFQVQAPFLLYRTKEGKIYGIWFYESKECEQVAAKFEELISLTENRLALQSPSKKEKEKEKGKEKNKSKGKESAKGAELVNILMKAEQKQGKGDGAPPSMDASNKEPERSLLRLLKKKDASNEGAKPDPTPSPPQITASINGTNNVAAFFAQAASEQHQQPAQPQGFHAPVPPPGHHAPSMLPHPMATMPSTMHSPMMQSFVPIVPHNVMPGIVPAHPAALLAAGGIRPPISVNREPEVASTANPVMQRLLSNPGVHSVESIERQQRLESVSPNIESLTLSGKKVHLLDTAEPKLLSPMAFDQAQKGGSGGSALPRKAKETFEGPNSKLPASTDEITPLTAAQLQQAFRHLLDTDPSFIAKLHQAYVESLKNKLQ